MFGMHAIKFQIRPQEQTPEPKFKVNKIGNVVKYMGYSETVSEKHRAA